MSDFPVPFFPVHKFRDELIATARKIASPGKGILAADESTGTIGKRFSAINLENTRANRREYRRLLFTTEDIEKYISGVITYEETLFDKTEDGKKELIQFLKDKGVVVGIKTDLGARELPFTNGEKFTQGLTDLDVRCKKYYAQGARFCKWRNVVNIGRDCPSPQAIAQTANTLAQYAAISQANGLCPIVEPEILMDGEHTIEICQYWTEKVLSACYKALVDHNVLLEGTLLKPNMVLSGKECKTQADAKRVAACTVTALQRTVPAAVPGITFLSGGQSEEQATCNLNAMNAMDLGPRTWRLTFSYGRALQQTCIATWKGQAANVKKAQAALIVRAKANSEAQLGKYKGDAASATATADLHVKNYTY